MAMGNRDVAFRKEREAIRRSVISHLSRKGASIRPSGSKIVPKPDGDNIAD